MKEKQVAKTTNSHSKFDFKVWLSKGYYIRVDQNGHVDDADCLEGALGCIIRVHSPIGERNQNQTRALKVPRLLADTQRENAFICTLLEKEFTIVRKVLGERGGNVDGLIGADCELIPDLRKKNGEMSAYLDYDEAAENTNDSFIFARFEKGRTPCFSNVRLGKASVESHPPIQELNCPSISDCLSKLEETKGSTRPTWFVPLASENQALESQPLSSFLNIEMNNNKEWYSFCHPFSTTGQKDPCRRQSVIESLLAGI